MFLIFSQVQDQSLIEMSLNQMVFVWLPRLALHLLPILLRRL